MKRSNLPVVWFIWLRRIVLGLLVWVIIFWLWQGISEWLRPVFGNFISILPAVILIAAFWLVVKQPGWGATLLIGFGLGFPLLQWPLNGWPLDYILSNWMFYTPPLALGIALMIGVQLARVRRK